MWMRSPLAALAARLSNLRGEIVSPRMTISPVNCCYNSDKTCGAGSARDAAILSFRV